MKVTCKCALTSVVLAFVYLSGYSQQTIHPDKIHTTSPIGIHMPIMMDTANLKGDKFELKELLETGVSIPTLSKFNTEINTTDTTHFLYLSKPEQENEIQLLGFQLTADKYSKAKIKVTSPSVFRIYINNKAETSKTTVEDSLHLAKDASQSITLIPNESQFVTIKYLSSADNKAQEAIKIAIETEKEYETAKLRITYDSKRPTKIQDILEGERINRIYTSPNGQFVLLQCRSVQKGGDVTNYTKLMDTKTGRETNLGGLDIAWMPKSNKYYYTQQRENKTQLITVDPTTMNEYLLAQDIPIGSFTFAPNEQFLLFSEEEDFDFRKGDLKLLASPNDRQPNYFNRYFIHKFDLETGVKQRLTFGNNSTYLNDVSANSRYILFATSIENLTERPFRKSSMYQLDLETMKVDTLWQDEAFVGSASYSPDGQKIIIAGSGEAFGGIALNIKEGQIANSYNRLAFIMDMRTKEIDPFTKDFKPSINSGTWNHFDGLIYLEVVDKDYERVYSYNPRSKKFTQLFLSEDVVSDFHLASTSGKASYVGQSLSNTTRAHLFDLKKQGSTLLSDPKKELFANLELAKVEDWNFTASDGTTIEGRYYLPHDFDASKKYPMIVYYYGGTTPTARTFEHPYSMQVYAALGYVVYVVQPSGAIGYGQEFSARHVNAWGKRTADDIIEGTKQFVKEHPYVNEKKIGCVGASYGGFMTMYLQTQTDIFAAAISHAGISALSSYWGEGYWGFTYSSGASAHSYPWNNKELYLEQSPLFQADKINTPILLLHGAVDTNVPVGESIQMYTALKILGKTVEYIEVKDENHGIANYNRRVEWNYSIYSWFAKWLKDEGEWWEDLYGKK